MGYFKNAKVGEKVFGLIFGSGTISQVFDESHFKVMVTFDNGFEVPYTENGVPGWGNFTKQTMFYKNDIDLTDVDFSPVKKVLSNKKIIKLREKGKLEVRLPSGIWNDVADCPAEYLEDILTSERFHLFRKKIEKNGE
jgi:hypothetical protein